MAETRSDSAKTAGAGQINGGLSNSNTGPCGGSESVSSRPIPVTAGGSNSETGSQPDASG